MFGFRINLIGVALGLAVGAGSGVAAPADAISPRGLSGRAVDPLAEKNRRAVVLVFIATDCPISNRYAPQLNRLAVRCAGENIAFWFVYPARDATVGKIQAHRKDFALVASALTDPGHVLVKRAQVAVTPEAAVFVPAAGKWIYRGRIDDTHDDFGRSRPEATTHDLGDVIEALVRGEIPASRTTKVVGCYISE